MSNPNEQAPAAATGPGVDTTMDWVGRLRATVKDFTAREDALTRDIHVRLNAVRRRREEDLAALTEALPGELAAAEAGAAEARHGAEARHAARQARIAQLRKSIGKRAAAWIEETEGKRKHRLQTEELQNERGRTAGLNAAEQAYADFAGALAAEQQAIETLAAQAGQSFRPFGALVPLATGASAAAAPAPAGQDEHQLLEKLRACFQRTAEDLRHHRGLLLPKLCRVLWLWVLLILALVPLPWILPAAGIQGFTPVHAGAAAGAGALLLALVFIVARGQARPGAVRIGQALAAARLVHEAAAARAAERRVRDLDQVEADYQAKVDWIRHEWDAAVATAAEQRESLPRQLEAKAGRASATNDRQHQSRVARLDAAHAAAAARIREAHDARVREVTAATDEREARLNAELAERWQPLETEWKTRLQALYAEAEAASAGAARLFPPWSEDLCRGWSAPAAFPHLAPLGRLEIDVPALAEGAPKDPRLALPGPARLSVPLLLTYPRLGSLLLETQNGGRDEALATLNNLVLRLLSVAPPGRLSFTVIDPVGLGQSFSGVMHLADYAEHVINSRIWTQTQQIEQRLADLNEHMEKVIQMYLRSDYATIADYNEQAGTIAEKYHFIVVADFPSAFSETAARRLLSIATSGARCGVYTLIHWDKRQAAPQDFTPDELRQGSVTLVARHKDFVLLGPGLPGVQLQLEAPPAPDLATGFIHKVGVTSRDSNRIEVPFSQITPAAADRWSLETTGELRVAIGRTGATKLQYLAFGKGTRQHGLVAGKTGSGKSTLFHVLITNLALWCSPEQVEFYLIDFKKGVEFKCYGNHRLPHGRVVAIESDREFALSVLQKLDDELKRRGDLYRKLGVQDLAGYKKAGGTEPMPRTLLLIDEFQEFFVEDDKIAQTASLLLDRIVRQGRAFGIHALLGSQTLGGAYTMARTTLGQMVVRIALQCNEADAYLIMDDSNPAPRLLSRPGEGIYNDTAGTVEGNSPFQVVWLSDDERDAALEDVRHLADRSGKNYPGPIVFEGNAPSEIRENPLLAGLLAAPAITPSAAPRIWLGAPNAIKGPTEVAFHRQSGNNLMLVGQREEAILSIFTAALVSLAAQSPKDGARILFCDGSAPGTPPREHFEKLVAGIPANVTLVKAGDLPEVMQGLAEEMSRRIQDAGAAEGPPVFLLIHGLQKFNKLRWEEDFSFSTPDPDAPPNPALILNNLLCEGTRLGFHVIASCDSYNNVNRFLSRKAFSEFEQRVLFQMSANDSASLIDSPKAGNLGLHRALLFSAQEAHLETFRPYAVPGADWTDEAVRQLRRLHGSA